MVGQLDMFSGARRAGVEEIGADASDAIFERMQRRGREIEAAQAARSKRSPIEEAVIRFALQREGGFWYMGECEGAAAFAEPSYQIGDGRKTLDALAAAGVLEYRAATRVARTFRIVRVDP